MRRQRGRARESGCGQSADLSASTWSRASIRTALSLVTRLHREYGACGAVIQAYLRRSARDIERLETERIRVRLTKGAYLEPPEIAFEKKAQVDRNYLDLAQSLLTAGEYLAIATHDEHIIDAVEEFASPRRESPKTVLNSRCSTASAATCSGAWCAKATACAYTYRSARLGIPTFMRRLARAPGEPVILHPPTAALNFRATI